jgi:hypothetical protein
MSFFVKAQLAAFLLRAFTEILQVIRRDNTFLSRQHLTMPLIMISRLSRCRIGPVGCCQRRDESKAASPTQTCGHLRESRKPEALHRDKLIKFIVGFCWSKVKSL